MTLELQLETAYAAVLQANEDLGDAPVRLNALILEQASALSDNEEQDEVEQVPAPSITLTAKRGPEHIPNSGIFETDLLIEARDNARDGGNDAALDLLFQKAARPLFYKTLTDNTANPPVVRSLFQVLSLAVANFVAYGMPARANGTEFERESVTIRRSISATILCQSLA